MQFSHKTLQSKHLFREAQVVLSLEVIKRNQRERAHSFSSSQSLVDVEIFKRTVPRLDIVGGHYLWTLCEHVKAFRAVKPRK